MATRKVKSASESKGMARFYDAQLLHYAAVGSVASEWAWFELWVDFKILELGKIPFEAGLCITSQVSGSARKLGAYIALARHLGVQKALRNLNIFVKVTARLSERRNRVIHDPWVTDKDSHTAGRLEATARKSLRFLVVPVATTDVASLSADIIAHVDKFDEIHNSILLELSTSP